MKLVHASKSSKTIPFEVNRFYRVEVKGKADDYFEEGAEK